jgi:hypothetical protein
MNRINKEKQDKFDKVFQAERSIHPCYNLLTAKPVPLFFLRPLNLLNFSGYRTNSGLTFDINPEILFSKVFWNQNFTA